MSMLQKDTFSSPVRAEQDVHSRHMGGMFSPLAQYPGAGYERVFSTGRMNKSLPLVPRKPAQKTSKNFVRNKVPMASIKAHSFTSALLLVEMEGNARMDRSALREAGIGRVQVLTSGLLAGRFLGLKSKETEADDFKGIDIIVCHPRLEDMSALQWIELMRLNPALKNIPVIVIAGNAEEGHLFEALNCNFTSILTRPYSSDDVRRTLSSVQEKMHSMQDEEQEPEQTSKRFEAELERYSSYQGQGAKAGMHFHEGLNFLKEKSWDKAITALSKVLYDKEMKGEAEYGLASAWQGKKNKEKQCYYLNEACLSLVRSQKWARARHAYAQLLKYMPKALNPFVRTAESLIRAEKFRDAGATLLLGLGLGNTEDVLERLARACYYTENPPFTVKQIQKNFTAPELQKLARALPDELQKYSEAHAMALQKRREEHALLRAKAKELSVTVTTPFSGALSVDDFEYQNSSKSSDSSASGLTGVFSSLKAKAGSFSLFDESKSENKNNNKMSLAGESLRSSAQGKKIHPKDDGKSIVLEPLQEEGLEVEMFSPGLNEIATVIKTTWKLMNRK